MIARPPSHGPVSPAAHERSRRQIRTTRYTELPDLCASADIAEESPAARNGVYARTFTGSPYVF
jgi:hypothetical protein